MDWFEVIAMLAALVGAAFIVYGCWRLSVTLACLVGGSLALITGAGLVSWLERMDD